MEQVEPETTNKAVLQTLKNISMAKEGRLKIKPLHHRITAQSD